ncbi:glycosyltransferase family 4 protein [Spirosoma sp. KUDC1026]|uniref:glycosyltransferase family 4 protein n=1 Tax=Spirosoma sp. KUDC1026 TaxID=2745947 RepID=UPI00159BDD1E|nr:glycosyltransferase family 1 protein [Spirosoma sp. KUDC1026]QKZ12750.1 glycosyltransferase family 4 protein [Spirosoma sp. KUDC1026]
MPSLFFDAERLRDLNSGLGQVCLHLGHELVRQCPADWTTTFLVPKGMIGLFGDTAQYLEASWKRKIWIADRYEVWHCLHQDSVYLPRRSKLVLTIHDLNFLERADYSPDQKAKKLAALQRKVDQASALTAISAYTASVVQQNLHLSANQPLRVIPNGNALAETSGQATEIEPTLRIEQPYFLFVGVIHPKKNVHTLLPLLEAFPDYRLVLAGPDRHPYAQHIREQAEKLGTADRLIMPGAIDEATKRWLYAHCEAFLFPSLSEGFGLPVAEAMTFGKPVFISTLTSLPEVGGKEAYYFENFDPEHMAQVLHDGLVDFEQNILRQERLRRRAAGFSWSAVAGEYWKLYKDLVRNSPVA